MKSQNLDKLTTEEQDLLAALMLLSNFVYRQSYMIEVKLDNPYSNMLNADGGDLLHRHAGNGSREYAEHYGDPGWAIVHIEDEDVANWDWQAMSDRAVAKMKFDGDLPQ